MQYVAFVFAMLAFLFSILAAFFGNYHALLFTLPMALLFAFLGIKSAKQDDQYTIVDWLKKNRTQVLETGGNFQTFKITADTNLVQYTFVASFLLFTVKTPSRWYIRGQENTRLINLGYTLGSVLCGWWGIPWGPIFTVAAVVKNARGGNAVSVGALLGAVAASQRA